MPSRLVALILLGVVVAGGAVREAVSAEAPGTAGAPQPAQNILQAVDYAVLTGGNILLKFTFRSGLGEPPAVLVSHHPTASITLDFPATASAAGKEPIEINQSGLRTITVIQAGGRTRVVIALTRPHVYTSDLQGNELVITLRRPESVGRWKAEGPVAGGAVDAVPSVRNVAFERGDAGEGRIIVELSESAIPIDIRRQGKVLLVDFYETALSPRLQRRLDVLDFGTPVRVIDTYRVGDHVRLKIEIEPAAEYVAYQLGRQLVVASRTGEQ